jgi:hypothetical protein
VDVKSEKLKCTVLRWRHGYREARLGGRELITQLCTGLLLISRKARGIRYVRNNPALAEES